MDSQGRYLYAMSRRETQLAESYHRERVVTLEEEIKALKEKLAIKEEELKKRKAG